MVNNDSFTNPYFYMWFFICILQSFITSWAFLRCFKVKVSKPVVYILVALTSSVIPVVVRYLTNSFSALATLTFVATEIISCIFITYGSRFKVTVFFIANLFIDTICELFIHLCMGGALASMDDFTTDRVIASTMFIFVSTVAKYIFSTAWKKIVNKDTTSRLNWVFIIFPSAQMLACLAMMLQFVFKKNDIMTSLYFIFTAMMIFVISDVIFLKFITDFEKKKVLEQELRTMEYTRIIEEKHYENIEAKRYETAKIRHDIKNQIITMRHLISEGQLSDAEELINGLEKSLDSTKEYEYCSVPVVNAVIAEKTTLCEISGIDFSADISLDKPESIAKNHLCCIFSNLIDNAIKENIKINNPVKEYITLKANRQGEKIVINCRNPVEDNSPDRKLDPSASTGYGLKILRDIALQYNGIFDIEIKDGTCDATVVLAEMSAEQQ